MIELQDDAVAGHTWKPLSEKHKSRSEMRVRTTLSTVTTQSQAVR